VRCQADHPFKFNLNSVPRWQPPPWMLNPLVLPLVTPLSCLPCCSVLWSPVALFFGSLVALCFGLSLLGSLGLLLLRSPDLLLLCSLITLFSQSLVTPVPCCSIPLLFCCSVPSFLCSLVALFPRCSVPSLLCSLTPCLLLLGSLVWLLWVWGLSTFEWAEFPGKYIPLMCLFGIVWDNPFGVPHPILVLKAFGVCLCGFGGSGCLSVLSSWASASPCDVLVWDCVG